LAVVPTAIGYLSYAASAGSYYVTVMYIGQAVLLVAGEPLGNELEQCIARRVPQWNAWLSTAMRSAPFCATI
jgi:hypothetical protein